jgi:hypothetical protein
MTKDEKIEQSKIEVRNLTDILARYTAAVRAHETMGSQRREDQVEIQREFDEARRLICANIGYLINKAYD